MLLRSLRGLFPTFSVTGSRGYGTLFRARKAAVSLDEVPEPRDPRDQYADVDRQSTRSALMTVLATLTPEHREVVVLRFFEELKLPEIARKLDVRVGTVKSRLHYALAELRKKLPAELNPWASTRHSPSERP